MSRFTEKGVLLWLEKDGIIRTTKSELHYYSDIVKAEIIVPTELKTDFGSIPSFAQFVFPKDGQAVLAYVLHDYLYESGIYTRAQSDAILEEAMKSLGVSYWRRKTVHNTLKVSGWYAWNKHRENDKKDLI